jgi:hypothetical protein
VRRLWPGLLVWAGLVPFVTGASPEAGDSEQVPGIPQTCPGVPEGEPLIGGLASGQALSSGQSVTLQFSNRVFACGSWLTEITSQGCRNDWSFALTLPASALKPGTYSLSALSGQFSDLFGIAGPPPSHGGCGDQCSMSARGTGPQPLTDPGATLVIASSDGQCVTGQLTGFKDPIFPEAPDYNGAFFAVRCSP